MQIYEVRRRFANKKGDVGSEGALFVVGGGTDEPGLEGSTLLSDRVKAGEDGGGYAFGGSGGGVDDALLEGEAAGAYTGDCRPCLEGFVEGGGLEEVDVDVDHGGTDGACGHGAAGDGLEVAELGEVHHLEVGIVVDVAEDVDVGEAYLDVDVVAEGDFGSGDAGIGGGEECGGYGCHDVISGIRWR